MMKEYFEGWKEKDRVQIPDIKEQGFHENVIVRKAVAPVREKRQEDEYTGESPTVLLDPIVQIQAYVKRLSTGEEAPVDKDGFVIGKSAEADFVVKFNPTVSRKHASGWVLAGGYGIIQSYLCGRKTDRRAGKTDRRYAVYLVAG